MNNTKENMSFPIYNVEFDPNDETMGIVKVSIVKDPAIESYFVAMSKEHKKEFIVLATDIEKQTVTGALLIPDKEILRIDENGEYFNLIFESKTIEKLRNKFHKDNFTHQVNLDHETDVSNVYLIESWIKKSDKDKSVDMGLQLPNGSWIATYKIEDKELFEKVKTSEFNGFSIEAFIDKNVKKLKKEIKMENKEKENDESTKTNSIVERIFKKLAYFVSVKGEVPALDIDFTDNENETNVNLPEEKSLDIIYEQNQVLMMNYDNLVAEMNGLKARLDQMDREKQGLVEQVAQNEVTIAQNETILAEKEVELAKLKEEKLAIEEEKKTIKENFEKIKEEDSTGKLKQETKVEDIPNWKIFADKLKSLK